jgi:hypothetical protein
MNLCLRCGGQLGPLLALLALVGCATREPPTRHSPRGALAADAAAAAPLRVTQALDGEPPFPLASDAGRGHLEEHNAPAAAGHSHHGGHAHEH